jgi:hypothetical protein
MDWVALEPLEYVPFTKYRVEMAFDIPANHYSATVWDEHGTPRRLVEDAPFRHGTGSPPIPKLTSIHTAYTGAGNENAYIIEDFTIKGE